MTVKDLRAQVKSLPDRLPKVEVEETGGIPQPRKTGDIDLRPLKETLLYLLDRVEGQPQRSRRGRSKSQG